jgi:hypothetical protein
MASKQPRNIELCVATYRAQQVPGVVMLTATGLHPTSGYVTFFEQALIDVFPPEFTLWHVRPGGIVLEVFTPFVVAITFKAAKPVEKIVVHDAAGKHEVAVEQVPDFLKTIHHPTKVTGPRTTA